jgi:hypothetical protein
MISQSPTCGVWRLLFLLPPIMLDLQSSQFIENKQIPSSSFCENWKMVVLSCLPLCFCVLILGTNMFIYIYTWNWVDYCYIVEKKKLNRVLILSTLLFVRLCIPQRNSGYIVHWNVTLICKYSHFNLDLTFFLSDRYMKQPSFSFWTNFLSTMMIVM